MISPWKYLQTSLSAIEIPLETNPKLIKRKAFELMEVKSGLEKGARVISDGVNFRRELLVLANTLDGIAEGIRGSDISEKKASILLLRTQKNLKKLVQISSEELSNSGKLETTAEDTLLPSVMEDQLSPIEALKKYDKYRNKLPKIKKGDPIAMARLPVLVITEYPLTKYKMEKLNYPVKWTEVHPGMIFEDQVVVAMDEALYNSEDFYPTIERLIQNLKKSTNKDYMLPFEDTGFFSSLKPRQPFLWLMDEKFFKKLPKVSFKEISFPFDRPKLPLEVKKAPVKELKDLRSQFEREVEKKIRPMLERKGKYEADLEKYNDLIQEYVEELEINPNNTVALKKQDQLQMKINKLKDNIRLVDKKVKATTEITRQEFLKKR